MIFKFNYLLFLLEYLIQHPGAKVCKCDYYLVNEDMMRGYIHLL